MEELLGYLPKLVVSVGLLYFALNPEFRHQNTINRVDLSFIAMGILVVSFYTKVINYVEIAWILGILTVFYIGAKITFFLLKKDGYILFNVFRKHVPSMEAFLNESAQAAGLAPTEWRYSEKYPYSLVFQTGNRAAVKKIVKETENFIRKHIPFEFWNGWLWIFLTLCMLASLWRF